MNKVVIDGVVYFVSAETRVQEGASWDDIESGFGYELVYLVYDEEGECIWDTTNYERVKEYFEEV